MTQELQPYRCDLRLVWLGREHSKDMIVRDFFDHKNPDGEQPWDRANRHDIGWSAIGENISEYVDLEEIHWGLMDSSGHRTNILDSEYDFSYCGVGIIMSGWLGTINYGVIVANDVINHLTSVSAISPGSSA